jgi:hypothetical protein
MPILSAEVLLKGHSQIERTADKTAKSSRTRTLWTGIPSACYTLEA